MALWLYIVIFLECWKLLGGILRAAVGEIFLEGLVMPDLHRPLTSRSWGERERQKSRMKDKRHTIEFFVLSEIKWARSQFFEKKWGDRIWRCGICKYGFWVSLIVWCFRLKTEPKKEWKHSSTSAQVQEPFTSCQNIPVKELCWCRLQCTGDSKNSRRCRVENRRGWS